jgi:hypothetical protein
MFSFLFPFIDVLFSVLLCLLCSSEILYQFCLYSQLNNWIEFYGLCLYAGPSLSLFALTEVSQIMSPWRSGSFWVTLCLLVDSAHSNYVSLKIQSLLRYSISPRRFCPICVTLCLPEDFAPFPSHYVSQMISPFCVAICLPDDLAPFASPYVSQKLSFFFASQYLPEDSAPFASPYVSQKINPFCVEICLPEDSATFESHYVS